MWKTKGAYRILMGTPDVRRTLGRPRRRWQDIKTDLQEVGGALTGFIRLRIKTGGGAFVNAVMNVRVP